MRSGTVIALMAAAASCGTSPDGVSSNAATAQPPKANQRVESSTRFVQSEPFDLRLITSNSQYPSSQVDTTLCEIWNLSLTQVSELIAQLKPLSGEDWHYLFEHWPCQVIGELDQAGVVYRFAINGGSWSTVTSKDTTLYFGDLRGSFKSYFISSVWNLEEDK